MEKTMKVGLYARVSTNDQQTLPMQLSSMREYVERRGWTVAAEVSEIGSGAKEREKREELLKTARRREIDTIVVWRLNPLGTLAGRPRLDAWRTRTAATCGTGTTSRATSR